MPERTSPNESMHGRQVDEEHSYAMQGLPTPATGVFSSEAILNLPDSQTGPGFEYVPENWLATLLDDSNAWDVPSSGDALDALTQSGLEELLQGGDVLSADPFLGNSDTSPGCSQLAEPMDVGELLSKPWPAPQQAQCPGREAQVTMFEQWLEAIKVSPTGAAATATPSVGLITSNLAATAPPVSNTNAMLQDERSPTSPSSSSDGGYDSASSPLSTSGASTSACSQTSGTSARVSGPLLSDIAAPISIAENAVRGCESAAGVLDQSVVHSPAVSSSLLPPSEAVASSELSSDPCEDDDIRTLEEKERLKMSGPTAFNSETSMFWNKQQRYLTEEEKGVLAAEGLPVPNQLPYTPVEVKAIKVVRRKIKNKLAAYDSRRKKKHYIEGLEKRLKHCTRDSAKLQKRVDTLETENRSLLQQLNVFRKQFANSLPSSVPQKSAAGGFGLMVFALCFIIMLPSMPNTNMVSMFSAKTKMAVSQMPTTSPAATAFDYRVKKQHQSRTLLGYSLPTSLPDLQDSNAALDDSSQHYVGEAAVASTANSTSPHASVREPLTTLNVHAGHLLIGRVKPHHPLHVVA